MKLELAFAAVVITATLATACAELKHFAPLELQPPPKKVAAFEIDIGADSMACLSRGQVLRYVEVEGEEPKSYQCWTPEIGLTQPQEIKS